MVSWLITKSAAEKGSISCRCRHWSQVLVCCVLHSQNKVFMKQNNLSFICVKCYHIMLCFHLIEPNLKTIGPLAFVGVEVRARTWKIELRFSLHRDILLVSNDLGPKRLSLRDKRFYRKGQVLSTLTWPASFLARMGCGHF